MLIEKYKKVHAYIKKIIFLNKQRAKGAHEVQINQTGVRIVV